MAGYDSWKPALKRISERFSHFAAEDDAFSRISLEWGRILGDDALARFSMLEYFRNGVIGVKADSAAAFSSLLMRKDMILASAQKLLPSLNIRNIVISR